MKKLFLILAVTLSLSACTSDNDFNNGKRQLETMGYTDVKNIGYTMFCCDENDTFSTGFSCKDKTGTVVKGCFCSHIAKGVTIRFE